MSRTINIQNFLSTDINLNSCVITKSLNTHYRWNFLALLWHRNELNSLTVCENIEKAIRELKNPLNDEQKEHALKNLRAMKVKFENSADLEKSVNCGLCIDTIINLINGTQQRPSAPQPAVAPQQPSGLYPVIVPSREQEQVQQRVRASAQKATPAPQATAPSATIKTQAPVTKQHSVIDAVEKHDTHGAMKKLRDAISLSTSRKEISDAIATVIAPDLERIKKIETGITTGDRLAFYFNRELIYSRHENKYFFNAQKLIDNNGFRNYTVVRVEAIEINKVVQAIREDGKFEVGGQLRIHMQALGYDYKETV